MENQNDIFCHSYVQQIFIEHCYMPGPVLLAGEISMSKMEKVLILQELTFCWEDIYKPGPTYPLRTEPKVHGTSKGPQKCFNFNLF